MTRLLRALPSAPLIVCLCLAGCQGNYLASVIYGEVKLLSKARPIEEAANDPNLPEDERDKLAFVIQARDYAEQVVGLRVGSSYQTFVDLGDGALAWNLSASKKDAFAPYYWNVPVIGRIPYLGYFSLNLAETERDRLVGLGYDTLIYEVDAYSTLDALPDPVTSDLLRRDWPSLADTVFHELTHNTIYSDNDTTYDESVAVFVGRTASQEFLSATFGPDSDQVHEAQQYYQDSDRFQTFLQGLMSDLQTIYDSDASFDDKMTQREAAIAAAQQDFASDVLPLMNDQAGYQTYTTFPFNNAYLLVQVRYNSDQDLFQAVYDSTGHDWAQTLQAFRAAAASPDPTAYLTNLVPQ